MKENKSNGLEDIVSRAIEEMKSEQGKLAEEHELSEEQFHAVGVVFEHLRQRKVETTIHTLLKMSRLPLKDPKTFDNFNFDLIKGRDVAKLKSLPSLAAIYAHRNLAFIGPAGTGKTHLAQAFGYECCQRGIKTYFIKMSELRDRFTAARRAGREASVLDGLVRPSCLIIDEVGHCEFDKENTRLFFDLIDRRYNKEGSFNIVFTSIRLTGEPISTRMMLCCAHSTGSSTMPQCSTLREKASEVSDWKRLPCRLAE